MTTHDASSAAGGAWMAAVRTCLSKYSVLAGRASLSEYWLFMLAYGLAIFVAALLDTLIGSAPLLTGIILLGGALPSITATVRRLHDTGRGGEAYFVGFIPFVGGLILLVLLLQAGERQGNRFGPPAGDPPCDPGLDGRSQSGHVEVPPARQPPATVFPQPAGSVTTAHAAEWSRPALLPAVDAALPADDEVNDPTVGAGRPSVARAPALRLRLPDQRIVPVDGPVVLGRRPEPPQGIAEVRLEPLDDPDRMLSRSHVLVRPGGDVDTLLVEDLGSINGTWVLEGEATTRRLQPGVARLAGAGSVIRLSDIMIEVCQ